MIQTTYTAEHYLFLWKYFRHLYVTEFYQYSPEKLSNSNISCFELRDVCGDLIACCLSENNTLLFAAVNKSYKGSGYQRQMIEARLEAIQSFGYHCAEVQVRCNNIASLSNLLKAGFKVTDTFRYSNDDEGFRMEKEF
jgi:RimJ/RimL family protein N-acetyltransferase